MSIKTYTPTTRDQTTISDDRWQKFRQRVNDFHDPIAGITRTSGIEEDPPRFEGTTFYPGGWVGIYATEIGVIPNPDRITTEGYEQMLEDTEGWLATLGALSAKALAFSPDIVLDARALYASYSERLIELTEQLLASRMPVKVERDRVRRKTLVGRPVFSEMQQELAARTGQFVSETVTFEFDNLRTRLLVRFHAELLQELRWVRNRLGEAGRDLDTQLAYHRDFLEKGLPVDNTNDALRTDFADPQTMATLRGNASPEMTEIVDVWEAYQRDQARKLDPTEAYNACIKPLSKMYELWLLTIIVDFLQSEINEPAMPVDDTLSEIRIGDVRVYHDTSRARYSKYVTPFLQATQRPSAGKPDLMIEVDGDVRWIGEAKCRPWENINKDDALRFLAYIADYLDADPPTAASLIAPNNPTTVETIGTDSERLIEGHPTVRKQATPSLHESVPDWLISQFEDIGIIDY